MGHFRQTIPVALCTVLALVVPAISPRADVAPASDDERRFVDGWVLVQLQERLAPPDPDQAYALTTGRPGLDARIRELGVERIDAALPNSARGPQRLAAFRQHGLDRIYRFHVPEGADLPTVVARLASLDEVVFAEPDYLDRLQGAIVPNDSFFGSQWGFDQASDADVDGPEAWSVTTGGPMVIAVLDSGIDSDHIDLVSKIDAGYDFVNDDTSPEDDFSHGTWTSSVAAAAANNLVGMASSCWGCRLMPLKVFDENGETTISRFADAMVWATDHGADIVNYSAGGTDHSLTRITAVRYAYDAGTIVSTAAGNTGGGVVLFPARYRETIATGASTVIDERWEGSSTGRTLDVIAPGEGIFGASDTGGFQIGDGTSLAAPLVSGLLGLITSIHPAVGREEAAQLIQAGVEDQVGDPAEDTPGWDTFHGAGRVNMHRTLQAAQSSVSLRATGGAATRLFLETANPTAASYDFVRGDLATLSESAAGVDLGSVVCLLNDSPLPDTVGDEDLDLPVPGAGFFYLARFSTDDWSASYGGSSRHRDRSPAAQPLAADWVQDGEAALAQYGYSIGSAGDVNGDGYDDVIVGANQQPAGVGDGVAYVYHGSAAGLTGSPAWRFESTQANSLLGHSVSGAGDVNDDGFDDVVVGEPRFDFAAGDNEGRALIFFGSSSGLSTTPDQVLADPVTNARFGSRVRSAGDVNDDGHDDVIIGAPQLANGQNNEGRAYLFLGGPTGVGTPSWTFESDQVNARAGTGVGSAGDVNNDGYDDVLVGAPQYDNGEDNEGRAWLFLGSPTGPSTTPTTILELDVVDARFGSDTSSAGDLDGDMDDEVVIVAFRYANPELQEGGAFVFSGSPAGLGTSPSWSFETDRWRQQIRAAKGAGDADNDGFDDLVVGSEWYRMTDHDEGRAWVFHGSGSGPATSATWAESPGQRSASFGRRVAWAGDVDNDGYDDLVVAAHKFDAPEFNEGRVYLYRGGPTGLTATALHACDLGP